MEDTVTIRPETLQLTSLDAATGYTGRGWKVVPVNHRKKKPIIDEWEKMRLTVSDLPHHFNGKPQNVGVLLGEPSNGLTDLDLDCPEAIKLAPQFLPETDCIFGRPTKQSSHWIYICDPMVPRTVKYQEVRDVDVGGKKKRPMLVEVRSTGGQTIFPPSTHESGEPIRFVKNGEPSKVDGPTLVLCARKLAAASLLARHWPGEGSRHDCAGALAGGLSRARWEREDVRRFVGAVARAAGDDEVEDRERVATDTFDNLAAGRNTTGWRTLLTFMCEDAVGAVRKWLGIKDWESLPSLAPSEAQPAAQPAVPVQPKSVRELIQVFPTLRPPVIHGLLRRGETMNIIAAPKTGKSWLAMDLAMAVTAKRAWLDRFPTEPGDVIIYDNELHGETSISRLPVISNARGLLFDDFADRLHIENVRGHLRDVRGLGLQHLSPNRYSIIILDAFYRFIPPGTDENDNAAMAGIYNYLDSCADRLGCCFVLIHHSSKGNQSGKSVTDVGAGAGSQARAADAHLILRPHEEEGVVVLDAVVRSWAPLDPFCLRWNYPIWTPETTLDPSELRQEGRRTRKRQQEVGDDGPVKPDWTIDRFVAEFLASEGRTEATIITLAEMKGVSGRKGKRLLEAASEIGQVHRWVSGSKTPDRFSTRPPNLSDIAAPTKGVTK